MFMSKEELNYIKGLYPVGSKIKIISMGEDINPIESGTVGVIKAIDDIGTLHCEFENGRSLGVIVGEDRFEIIDKE